jgi:pimeloyl-ACP methyl ester carboxylesterase
VGLLHCGGCVDERKVIALESPGGRVELAYLEHGAGEPLLLLHGFFGCGGDWTHLPGLGAGMRQIVPDLRGHGWSSNPSPHFSFRDAAEDVLRLLDALNIARCRAVGLSAGALTLLRMAIVRPAAIDVMVLVSASDGFGPEARTFMAQFAASPESRSEDLRARHVGGERQVDSLFAAARDFAQGNDDASVSSDELARIRARTLIVAGERDPLYPLETAARLTRSIANAELWVIPEAGHTPVFTYSRTEFIARARSFLR